MKKLILTNRQSPGDILMLTAAVRDLHLTYPGRFLTDVRTSASDLWLHNPHITPIADDDPDATTIKCEYPLISRCHQSACHFLHGFIQFFNETLDLNIQLTDFKGDLHLSPEERSLPSPMMEWGGVSMPYWIVAAGGKFDFTIKWWPSRRYQEVVDAFRDRVQFVQVGEKKHYHPRLDGVMDLRGETDLRALIRLVYHSQGVLCPVTFLMHLAAATPAPESAPPERPCVVVAGGREPPHWEAYPHHQFIHNVGTLACNEVQACWRSRIVPIGDEDEKDDPATCCLDVVNGASRCMDMVSSDEVVRRMELYFNSPRVNYLEADQARRLVLRNTRSLEEEFDLKPRVGEVACGSDPEVTPPITVCVLTYGNHLDLVRKTLESIYAFGDRGLFRLVVGANEPGLATRAYLKQRERDGSIDRLIISESNLNKCPMMRRMLDGVETEYVWWFDDDSHLTEPGVMSFWLREAEQSAPHIVMWGQTAFMTIPPDEHLGGETAGAFVRSATWNRGLIPPSESDSEVAQTFIPHAETESLRWYFVLGGCWLIKTSALRATDWPDPRLAKGHDDVFLGEALRQQGLGIACVSHGVAIDQAKRRGDA